MTTTIRTASFVALLFAFTAVRPAWSVPILGEQLFYDGGDVVVTSLPVTSGFVSELGLYDSGFSRLLNIMQDEPPGVMVTFNPGDDFGFSIGDELIFGIRVLSDSNREYFMGPAARNPDGIEHAVVDDLGGGTFIVGFEDLFGGGDRDFDDNRFEFSQGVRTQLPAPSALALIGVGLIGMLIRRIH